MREHREHTEAAKLLMDAFCHRRDAYARQFLGAEGSVGYVCEKSTVTLPLLEQHVEGAVCLGAYSTGKDDSVRWACIDIDAEGRPEVAAEAARRLVRTAAHFSITLMPEHSGKKGTHLWLLTQPDVPAALARRCAVGLTEVAEIGEMACSVEVFPKQDSLRGADEAFGNLVKLPWGKRLDNGARGLLLQADCETLAAGTDGQLQVLRDAIAHRADAESLGALVADEGWQGPGSAVFNTQGQYTGLLPCYSQIIDPAAEVAIRVGHRDKVLFAFAKQHRRQKTNPALAVRDLLQINADRCRPALEPRVVRQKVDSAYKSAGGGAGCETLQEAGLCPALEGAECPIYRKAQEREVEHQHSAAVAGDALSIEPLYVSRTEPPIYTATVQGRPLRLTLKQLLNLQLFKERCVSELDCLPLLPTKLDKEGKKYPPGAVWEMIVREALKGVIEEEEAPADAGPRGAVWDAILEFIRQTKASESLTDLNRGRVIIVGEDYLFRGHDLRKSLRLNGITSLPESELWMLIRDHGGRETRVRPDRGSRRQVRAWRVPAAATEEIEAGEGDEASENLLAEEG